MLVVNADGGCNPNPGRGSFGVVAKRDGHVVCRISKGIGYATNNIAEWRGALAALGFALSHADEDQRVELRMDSRLVVEQLRGRWRVKHPGLKPLASEGARLLGLLSRRGVKLSIQWVPRAENAEADALAGR